MLKKQLKRLVYDTPVWDAYLSRGDQRSITYWVRDGCPSPPPPIVKRQTILEYAEKFKLTTLVETGTYLGDTVYSMKDRFTRIASIELSQELYERAKARFQRVPHVTIHHGDSATVLPRVLTDIHAPCLFWLDGHYSGGQTALADKETPILAELEAVASHSVKGHVILIDDAREFVGGDYPTIPALRTLVTQCLHEYSMAVKDDMIRITP